MHPSPVRVAALLLAVLCPSLAAGAPAQKQVCHLAQRYGRALPEHRSDDTTLRRAQRARAVMELLALGTASAQRTVAAMAAQEPNSLLQKYMVSALPRSIVDPAVLAQVFPKAPPIPAEGPIGVRTYVGPEFFRAEVAQMRRDKFEVRGGPRVAHARKGRMDAVVRKDDRDVYRDMGNQKVHVVVNTLHADVGGVNTQSMRSAPAQQGDKLIVSLQCHGDQTMPELSGKFTTAHIITTRHPSDPDEDRNILRAIYRGVRRGDTYAQIRKWARARNRIENYIFPDQRLDTRQNWDLDKDGRVDFHGDRRVDRAFDVQDGRHRLPGQKLLSAAQYLNVANEYYVEDTKGAFLRRKDIKDLFRSGGVAAEPFSADRMVTFRARQEDGRPVKEVLLNPLHARQPRAFVAAAAIYEMELAALRGRVGRIDDSHRAVALMMATDYLWRLASTWEENDGAIRKLVRFEKLPEVRYDQLEAVLMTDQKVIGSRSQIGMVKKLFASRPVASR
jgi:hypothetical protein